MLDLDRTGVNEAGDFELILAFGVLYHLAHPEEFLRSCGKTAKVLLLETAVCDRREPVVEWVSEPVDGGAGSGLGARVSPEPSLGRSHLPRGRVRRRPRYLQPARGLEQRYIQLGAA